MKVVIDSSDKMRDAWASLVPALASRKVPDLGADESIYGPFSIL